MVEQYLSPNLAHHWCCCVSATSVKASTSDNPKHNFVWPTVLTAPPWEYHGLTPAPKASLTFPKRPQQLLLEDLWGTEGNSFTPKYFCHNLAVLFLLQLIRESGTGSEADYGVGGDWFQKNQLELWVWVGMNWRSREDMNLDGLSTVSSLADYLKLESRKQPRQAFEEHSSKLLTHPWIRQARNHSFPAKHKNLWC